MINSEAGVAWGKIQSQHMLEWGKKAMVNLWQNVHFYLYHTTELLFIPTVYSVLSTSTISTVYNTVNNYKILKLYAVSKHFNFGFPSYCNLIVF
jgi:hypothetical protein